MGVFDGVQESRENSRKEEAKQLFQGLIQTDQYVGDTYSINYETANVIINDNYRNKVGGIPSLSFLIATRIDLSKDIDFMSEDASFILLRVMDSAILPQDKESERIRVESAQRVSGTELHWDDKGSMDYKTKYYLSFAGVKCRIIGTFFLEVDSNNPTAKLNLRFGSDISNYYPNRGLKVYKPNGNALSKIINYIDPNVQKSYAEQFGGDCKVKIGHIRYASTNRQNQNINNVPVYIYPSDLLSQKSALFGMTRTGKSNTTKIIAKSVYELRVSNEKARVGQIIFDPNGEYANENVQDNNSALKNVWKLFPGVKKESEVVTYGITTHPNDPNRKLMKLNFYLDNNLQLGKEIIGTVLSEDTAKYITNFVQVSFERPENYDSNRSVKTRYDRKVLVYRSILAKAGFDIPNEYRNVRIKGLFGENFRNALLSVPQDNDKYIDYQNAANLLARDFASLDQLSSAFEALNSFFKEQEYKTFEQNYIQDPNHEQRWADDDLCKLIGFYERQNGTRQIGKARLQHSNTTKEDYADEIYNDLKAGKLVIVDQSMGEPDLNKSSALRIITKIFKKNQALFRDGEVNIPEILVYVEEAHNILPAGNDLDLSDMWVRTAKEGAKYHIGMVYATQEVSSIQKNILKNTSNWFISHLNNTDETKELCKYYDFADFEPSIRRAQDKGFLRVKTLSNLFVIPVQVDKFEIKEQ